MTTNTARLLEAFEGLSEEEKRAFTVEFLRKAVPFYSGSLVAEAQAAQAPGQPSLTSKPDA